MTAYTNNTPQAGQTISETQPLILDNFGFLDTAIGTEHNFDVSDPAATYHLQASMPNISPEPAALPAGTDGIFYVFGGQPKFYDGTTNYNLSLGNGGPLRGVWDSILINVSASSNILVTGNVSGTINIFRSDGEWTMFTFFRNTNSNTFSQRLTSSGSGGNNIALSWNSGTLRITNNGSNNYTFNYSAIYFPTA